MTTNEIKQLAEEVATHVAARVETQLQVYIARKDAECAAHHIHTGNHAKTLYGNGTPGLKTTVDRLTLVSGAACFLAASTLLAVVLPLVADMIKNLLGS